MINEAKNWIANNKRYIAVFLVLLFTYFINQEIFTKKTITAEDCAGGKCLSAKESLSLSDEIPFYYLDDELVGKEKGYYRLTFKAKSNKSAEILVKATTYLDEEENIGRLEVDSGQEFVYKELNFFFSGEHPNVLFEKENWTDGAEIYIQEANLSRLNINSEGQFVSLKPTVIGETKWDVFSENQIHDSSYSFPWLREKKSSLGQVFKSNSEYITGITLNMDIIQTRRTSSKQYVLSLREVDYDGKDIKASDGNLASLNFSTAEALKKYRQSDGTFLFPLVAKLEKGKHYFLSIDNSKVNVGKNNFLSFRGSKEEDAYQEGSAAMKKGSQIYKIDGDLFFSVHSAQFKEIDGNRILSGAKIEDLGGSGLYTYETKGLIQDLLDVELSSGGSLNFREDLRSFVNNVKGENDFVYKFYMRHPMKNFTFLAEKVRPGWNRVKILYSFDGQNWKDIPYMEKSEEEIKAEELPEEQTVELVEEDSGSEEDKDSKDEYQVSQIFDHTVAVKDKKNEVYIKVTYDADSPHKSKYFGVKNLKFRAELDTQ